jgi:transcriptional regulator with XRE-family HTH domain
MSASSSTPESKRRAASALALAVTRLTMGVGGVLRDERLRRRWTLRTLAQKAGSSVAAVHSVESGRPASLRTYVAIADALGLRLEFVVEDARRRHAPTIRDADFVHAAMGELEAARLSPFGFGIGIDEPYQHYQFAGRADVIAWDPDARALLHVENRTRFPDIQEVAGAWNAKRTYLPAALAERFGLRRDWASVTHVMAGLWSAEVLHVLRLRTSTLRALCPNSAEAFAGWWSGRPPTAGTTSSLVLLDPCAIGRQRLFVGLDTALSVKPRHRGYADAVESLRTR